MTTAWSTMLNKKSKLIFQINLLLFFQLILFKVEFIGFWKATEIVAKVGLCFYYHIICINLSDSLWYVFYLFY